MSTLFSRNRIRLGVSALALGVAITATGATAQATPAVSNQPTAEQAPVAGSGSSAFGINWDPGMITASAAAPLAIVWVIGCMIGLSTGSTKTTPGNDNPCLPI